MNAMFDIAIIGGGINGAGVARDAAGRGGRVVLFEARDLASGTSSASTKLVHGGLRYLEYREFGLVREALRERDTLWSIAPHLVHPMRFVLPLGKDTRPGWMIRAGLFLYDHIGGSDSFPDAERIDLARHPAGAPLDRRFTQGFEYSDGWVDDARLVVLNAVDARRRGAQIRTRTPVSSARRVGDLWRIEAGGETYHARALVNAGGPEADDVAHLAGAKPAYGIRRVRGSHIVVPRLFAHDYAYIFQLPDTRICFAIPYEGEFTLIGTTDRDHSGSLVEVAAADDEVDYLCRGASRFFARAVISQDVVHTFAGVRALVDEGSSKPEAATRGYRLPISKRSEGAPLVGIYGGKITSYRHVAEEVCDKLARRLPALSGKAWTASEPLPGGDFPKESFATLVDTLYAEYPFLSPEDATRIARAYGLDAVHWLSDARAPGDLGRDFGSGLSEAEVDWLRREEFAVTAEDVLWRRTKLGLHMTKGEREGVREWMGG